MNRGEPEVYGTPPNPNIHHGLRIYLISVLFALIALVQWIIIGIFSDWRRYRMPQVRYGYWLVGTFFGICILSCTSFGRKFPLNLVFVVIIVEYSTLYIALEQQNTKGLLVNVYACFIVITLVIASIIWGAYFPMRWVPGDLMLSILVALVNIILLVFFINAYIFDSQSVYVFTRNFFAICALTMIMYTATIIHDRQFDVPKNEYLFLSVLLFFGHMILHERILDLAPASHHYMECKKLL